MKTKKITLGLSKKEIEAIKILREHAQKDLRYGVGGSYGDGENFDGTDYLKVKPALEVLNIIITILK